MFKQAFSMMFYRKKQALIVILVIALVMFLLLSISSVFSAVQDSTFLVAMEEYGAFHCIYYDLEEQHFAQLREIAAIREIGIIENYGNYPLCNTEVNITLGRFDETALALGRLKLLEGHWPQQEGEIAVEEHVLYQLPAGAGLGSTLRVQAPGGEMQYTICGVIKDYRSKWSVPDYIHEGVNDLPAGFIYNGQGLSESPVKSAMLYFHTLKMQDEPFSLEANVYHQQLGLGNDGVDIFNFKSNENLYSQIQGFRLRMSLWYEKYFVLLTLAGAGMILYGVLFGYYRNFREMSYTLYTIGAPRYTVCGLLLLNSLILCLPAAGLGFGGTAILSVVMKRAIGSRLPLLQKAWQIGIVILAVLAIAVIYYLWKLRPLHGRSYSARAQEKRSSRRKKEKESEEIGKHLQLALAARHVQANWKRLVAPLLVTAVLLTMVFCIQWDIQQKATGWFRETPTFSSMAATQWVEADYGPYTLSALHQFFDGQRIDQIASLPGVWEVYKGYDSNARLVVPRGQGAYWEIFMQNNDGGGISFHDPAEVPSIPQEQRATRFGFNFIVLNEQEQQWLQRAYPQLEVQKLLADGQAILFCPPIDEIYFEEDQVHFGEYYSSVPGGVAYNESVKAGDTLLLAWLESDLPLNEAVANPDQIRYREAQLPLSAVLNEPFYMERAYSIEDRAYELTILLSEETARQAEYMNGIFNFTVYMHEDISEEEYAAVEEAFNRIAYSISGTNNYSSREEEAFWKKMQYAHQTAFGILCTVLGGFIVVSLISTLYGTLLQRRRMFGILRASGLRRRQLFGMILAELLVYWMGMIVLCYGIALRGCYRFSVNVVGVYMEAAHLWLLAGKIGIILLGVLALFMGIAWLLTNQIWKQSVSEVIRFAE